MAQTSCACCLRNGAKQPCGHLAETPRYTLARSLRPLDDAVATQMAALSMITSNNRRWTVVVVDNPFKELSLVNMRLTEEDARTLKDQIEGTGPLMRALHTLHAAGSTPILRIMHAPHDAPLAQGSGCPEPRVACDTCNESQCLVRCAADGCDATSCFGIVDFSPRYCAKHNPPEDDVETKEAAFPPVVTTQFRYVCSDECMAEHDRGTKTVSAAATAQRDARAKTNSGTDV